MMSSALKILISLLVFSLGSALPRDQNHIRTQRKISHNSHQQYLNNDEIYFHDNRHLYPKAIPRFRNRGGSENDIDYDDIEPAPVEFTPAFVPPLGRELPKVDGSQHPARPLQRPVAARPVQSVRPFQSQDPAASPGSTDLNQSRRTLSNCGKAIVQCCKLTRYHNKPLPRCFERMGCTGGYYDAPCSAETQDKMLSYLKERGNERI